MWMRLKKMLSDKDGESEFLEVIMWNVEWPAGALSHGCTDRLLLYAPI